MPVPLRTHASWAPLPRLMYGVNTEYIRGIYGVSVEYIRGKCGVRVLYPRLNLVVPMQLP